MTPPPFSVPLSEAFTHALWIDLLTGGSRWGSWSLFFFFPLFLMSDRMLTDFSL